MSGFYDAIFIGVGVTCGFVLAVEGFMRASRWFVTTFQSNINHYLRQMDREPQLPSAAFTETAILENNWLTILEEFCNRSSGSKLETALDLNTRNSTNFPQTAQILQAIKYTFANFAIVRPGPGPLKPLPLEYAGIVRCYLPLVVPENVQNCAIEIHDEEFYWTSGKTFWTNPMVPVSINNNTPQELVLFVLDIERDFKSFWKNLLNKYVLWVLGISHRLPKAL